MEALQSKVSGRTSVRNKVITVMALLTVVVGAANLSKTQRAHVKDVVETTALVGSLGSLWKAFVWIVE